MHIDGACHCGAITYEAEVDPERVVICHCTDCQTFSSAPYRVSAPALTEGLSLKGEPKTYIKLGDSGREVGVAFCGDCGTALWSAPAGRPFVFLRVGAMKQRSQLPPKSQGFCKSAQPWASDLSGVKRLD